MSIELRRRMMVFLAVVAAGWFFICASLTTALAQEKNGTGNEPVQQQAEADQDQKEEKKTFFGMLKSGGFLMIPLVFCSVVALASTAERLISLQRKRVLPPGFVDEMWGRMKDGGGVEKGVEYCDAAPKETLIAQVLKAGLIRASASREKQEKALEEAGTRVADQMKRSLRIIGLVVAVAPLLGLLGTVFGMIESFQNLADVPVGKNRSDVLAEGIYVALVTTASGLTIAIPFLAVSHYLNNKVDQLIEGMGIAVQEFLDLLDGGGGGIPEQPADAARVEGGKTDTTGDTGDESTPGEPALAS